MTRTDVMASSRPRTAAAAPIRKRSIDRRLALLLPAVLLAALALMIPGAAFAASEGTAGYNQTPTTPATTPTTGTSPSKEEKATTPAAKEEPAKATTSPTTTEKAATLPFTGFDLRWSLAIGLLLMGAGFSIVFVQRRERRDRSR